MPGCPCGCSLVAPSLVPDALISIYEAFKLFSNATCEENYEATNFEAAWSQILTLTDVKGEVIATFATS
jgi:hypothetical protein